MCSGVVTLGLVLALVLAQETQDNRQQKLIHVRLADQVSHYNYQICRPRFLTSPEGDGERQWKPMFDPNIEILRQMAWKPFNFDIDFLSRYMCSEEKWTNYNTVKFKCLYLS